MSLGVSEVLILIAIGNGYSYGVAIQGEIVAATKKYMNVGSLYHTLHRLERKKLVRSRLGRPTPFRGGRAKRCYILTRKGSLQLEAFLNNIHAMERRTHFCVRGIRLRPDKGTPMMQ